MAKGSALLGAYRPLIDQTLYALAIIGVMVTVHLWIQQGRGFDQGCWGFNPPSGADASTFNCEAVVTSDAGQLFGISNVYWGILFYTILSYLGFLVGRAKPGQVQKPKKIRGAMIGAGFLYSLYLVNVQINGIGELCALCLTSAGIMALMFVVLLYDVGTSKNAAGEEPILPGLRFFKVVAGAAAVLIIVDLFYFNNLEVSAPATATTSTATELASDNQGQAGETPVATCTVDDNVDAIKDYKNLLSSFDPVYGPEGADVTVIEYFDPNCPHCQATHPVMKEIIAKYQDRVRFHLIPFPLRSSSLAQIEAMYVAKEQGKFFEMLDAQMAMQETRGLPVDQVRELATLIQMDVTLLNNRWRSGLYRRIVIEQQKKASEAGVSRVPAVIVNGQFVLHKTPQCISQFIDNAAS